MQKTEPSISFHSNGERVRIFLGEDDDVCVCVRFSFGNFWIGDREVTITEERFLESNVISILDAETWKIILKNGRNLFFYRRRDEWNAIAKKTYNQN